MNALSQERVHGGQGAVAGLVTAPPPIMAVARPRWGVIRVWQGCSAAAEEFTIDEARALCIAGDAALTGDLCPMPSGWACLHVDGGPGLPLHRQWLIAFLASVRRALRAWDAASSMAKAVHG
ncbi:MAG: hypothetical protein ACK4PC_03510 [Sphingopyxis sp.]